MKRTARWALRSLPPVGLTILGAGCGLIIGLDDFTTGAGGTGGAGGAGGAGGQTSSSTTDTSGRCTPGSTLECYDAADPGTKGKGACHAGLKTCRDDGSGYGICGGEVTPVATDDCTNLIDTTCDGVTSCPCTANAKIDCYDGRAGTSGVGVCVPGKKTCDPTGQTLGPCEGEILPKATDDCSNTVDEDCSGSYCTQTVWAKTFGQQNGPHFQAVTFDTDGDLVLGGFGSGSLNFTADPTKAILMNNGLDDGIVAKLDSKGNFLWAASFGDANTQSVGGVATDDDKNVYVVGTFQGSIDIGPPASKILATDGTNQGTIVFVLKFDPTGKPIWAKPIGDLLSLFYSPGLPSIAVHKNTVIIAGTYRGNMTLGNTTIKATNQSGYVGALNGNFSKSRGAPLPFLRTGIDLHHHAEGHNVSDVVSVNHHDKRARESPGHGPVRSVGATAEHSGDGTPQWGSRRQGACFDELR